MRFFDSWWEYVPTMARFAPVIVALLALAVFHRPLDYYWE
jgi:hypothetical protein